MSRWIVVVLMGVILQGCVGGTSPPVRFYVINPQTEAADKDETGTLEINIASLTLPEYLDRPQLVVRSGAHRLQMSEGHQWGGNLRKNLQRTLSINLSRQLGTPNVSFALSHKVCASCLRLELDILQFERMEDGRVSLIAQWRLSRAKNRELLIARIDELRSQSPIEGKNKEMIVAEMGALFAQLSRTVGGQIQKFVP